MPRKLFLNLPVADLARSVDFFSALGFAFEPELTDEKASAMVVGDASFVMLLAEDVFTCFTGQPVPHTPEVLIALSAESRQEVDDIVQRALAAGGSRAKDKIADGPMYGWSFRDLDGHHWELIHIALEDPVAPGGA